MVSIILFDKDKRILLQHRTEDDKKYPGMWGFFGGGIEGNETPLEAVKRECFEELNYKLKNPKLILKKKIVGKTFFLFLEKYDPSKKLTLQEGQGMGWFRIDEVNEIKTTQFLKGIISEVKATINSQT